MRAQLPLAFLTLCLADALVAAPSDLELHYDPTLTKAGFPSPLLRGTLQGQTVWFIIDTGAGVHTLASWLVNAAHLTTETTNATTTGSTGVESKVRVVHSQSIQLDAPSLDLPLTEAIVADFPPIFEQYRIGGLLSPQLLAPPDTAAILDLHVPRLSFGPPPTASAGTRVCRNADSPFTNRLYAADITADGTSGRMLIDTGATTSVAVPSSAIARRLSGHTSVTGRTQGIGGAATANRIVPEVVLKVGPKFGDADAVVALTLGGKSTTCAPDGLLGMDALRNCRLILGTSTFAWSCRVPR